MNLKSRIEEIIDFFDAREFYYLPPHIAQEVIADILKAIEELLLGEEEMEKIVDIIKDDWKFPCSIAIAQALYKAQRDKLR